MAQIFIKEFGDALETFLKAKLPESVGGDYSITGLTASNIKWSREITSEPRYIVNSSSDLPAVRIRFNTATIDLGMNFQLNINYVFSIYLYLQQTPGQDHQELIIAAGQKVVDSINNDTNAYRPTTFASVESSNQQLQQVFVTGIGLPDELRYDIDNPSLRESAVEIILEIKSISGLPTA